ncbi:MAG: hypothetical protein LUD77_00400 [Clostridiales bacterium]|nr:hypothetical protein [Clostridiales bacterium]
MCKILEDMRNEVARETAKRVARETAITTTIENFREIDMDENEIEERVMNKFNLSREKTKEYMLGKSA